jgi:hypothetical protein
MSTKRRHAYLENANKKDYIEKYARLLGKCGVALAW